MNKKCLYMKTTKDDLELPVAVAGSANELAEMIGTSVGTVKSSISHHYAGWHRISIDEEENDEQL